MNTEQLSKDIMVFRYQQKLSKLQMATICGVSKSTIQNLEDEIIRNPKPENYAKICEKMGVDPQKYF